MVALYVRRVMEKITLFSKVPVRYKTAVQESLTAKVAAGELTEEQLAELLAA